MDDIDFRALAERAHERCFDMDGSPHFLHVERIAEKFIHERLRAIAWLHDIIEDTREDAVTLAARGVPPGIIEAVEILTRRKDESYRVYIDRVVHAPGVVGHQARMVKLADLEDNLTRSRASGMEPLVRRYEEARTRIEETMYGKQDPSNAA